jgi:hypothetical protein
MDRRVNTGWVVLTLLWLNTTGTFGDAEKDAGAPIEVRVDPRVELLSIIFRLAGNPEYNQGRVDAYIQDIEKHFGDHRAHPVVELASRLRRTRGVSYDAPMSLAVHVSNATELAEIVPFEPHPLGLDRRWKLDEVREFLSLAKQFVKDTTFEAFLDSHRSLYQLTEARATELIEREGNLEWSEEFFGARPKATFTVILALVNGGPSYGATLKTDDREELYSIPGVWATDDEGMPRFDIGMLDTLVHEFCHGYVNPLVYAHTDQLREAGERMYAHVKGQMQKMAYGNWETMVHESGVRAAVVRYLSTTRSRLEASRQIRREIENGFSWMYELVSLFGEYEKQRDKYPTFESFFPRFVEFFDEQSKEFPPAAVPAKPAGPKIVELVPPNGAKDVDPTIKELRVVFDRPMESGFSWCGGGDHFPTVPEGEQARWSDDRKTCTLPVELKPNWEYHLGINCPSYKSFRSAEGVPLEPVGYSFSTRAVSEN